MLSSDQIAHFKELLEAEKKHILQELEQRAHKEPGNNNEYEAKYKDFGTEEDDNAEEYRQHEVNVSVVAQLEETLQEVNDALIRIEKGTYGICEKTGTLIAIERLEAYPAARYSIES